MKSGQNVPQTMSKVNKLPNKDIAINTPNEEGDSFLTYL